LDLDELPDTVYAPLGTRGMQPLNLKECPRCGNNAVEKLQLLSKKKGPRENAETGSESWDTSSDEYEIKCGNCGYNFRIKCQNVFGGAGGKERVVTFVHILTEDGENEGWIGNY
jgi:transcription elongation factor Elf1